MPLIELSRRLRLPIMKLPILGFFGFSICAAVQSWITAFVFHARMKGSKRTIYLTFLFSFCAAALICGALVFMFYLFAPHIDGTYLGPLFGMFVIIILTIVGAVVNAIGGTDVGADLASSIEKGGMLNLY